MLSGRCCVVGARSCLPLLCAQSHAVVISPWGLLSLSHLPPLFALHHLHHRLLNHHPASTTARSPRRTPSCGGSCWRCAAATARMPTAAKMTTAETPAFCAASSLPSTSLCTFPSDRRQSTFDLTVCSTTLTKQQKNCVYYMLTMKTVCARECVQGVLETVLWELEGKSKGDSTQGRHGVKRRQAAKCTHRHHT